MEWIEVAGRTLDAARERALDALGVHQSELEYEVIKEAKPGFLGRFGRVDARIRARVKPISRDKPNDRNRRRRGGPNGRAGRSGRARSESRPSRPTGGGGDNAPQKRRTPRAADPTPERAGTGPAAGAGSQGPPKRRRSRSRKKPSTRTEPGREQAERSERADEPSGSRRREEGAAVDEISVPIEEQAAAAETFVRGVVDALVVGARVTSTLAEDAVEVDVEGVDLGLLVGPKGATLAAIEELVRAAVSRTTGGHSARVYVDVAGYRRLRREALATFVQTLAEEVRTTGTAKAMEPMSPSDRKVIHDTVAEMDGVATASEGEDLGRHVVIRPS